LSTMKEKTIAILPARGGSKRIPRKNVQPFLGKPIIHYAIEAALHSKLFDEVMVSTDDTEIAALSRSFGASVPFFRSEKTSNDFAIIADVVEEVLQEYKKIGKEFQYCCCILPTAIFLTPQRLQEGYALLKKKNYITVFPVVQFSYSILRALKLENEKVMMIWPENLKKRSQDLESTYHDSGQFYWMNVHEFFKEKNLFTDNSGAIVLSDVEVQDIDTETDWKIAEMKYKLMRD